MKTGDSARGRGFESHPLRHLKIGFEREEKENAPFGSIFPTRRDSECSERRESHPLRHYGDLKFVVRYASYGLFYNSNVVE